MADMTDSAFCRVVKSVSQNEKSHPVIVFREMVSAEAVVRGNAKTLAMTDIHPDERPIVQQLFGSNPDIMAQAARMIEAEHHPEGFDINMGCPVYKIVHNFNGAALMREPRLATEIIKKMKAATTVPLSVKIRTGWKNPRECFEFARTLEDAGTDLITIHGRTKIQGYSGQSDWNLIGELKSTLTIPLLANGDIHTAPLTFDALKTTGCDGVLIARGALGNPWIFSQIQDLLMGQATTHITLDERIRVIKLHVNFHLEQYGESAITTFRKHLSWYFRGVPGARIYTERLHAAQNKTEIFNGLDEMLLCGLLNQALSDRDAMNPLAYERMAMAK
jgi:tRNA-dihydrouridine synthase B